MDLISRVFHCFHKQPSGISERSRILEINFECCGADLADIRQLFNFINEFPDRDEVVISLTTIAGDVFSFGNQKVNDRDFLELFLHDIDPEDDGISVGITINKGILNNTVSVYNFDSFSQEIQSKNLVEVMAIFNNLLQGLEYLVFELFNSNILISTRTMLFKSVMDTSAQIHFGRNNKLAACYKSAYFYNSSDFELLPDDFHVVVTCKENPFEQTFEEIRTILSLVYIANSAFIDNNLLKIQISGHRKIEYSYDLVNGEDRINNIELFNIYNWVYTDGNPVDKAIIARNIISLHCRYTQIIDTDDKTFASIQSNYSVYQKDNVTQYLDLKNKLAKFIIDLASQSGEITLGFTDRLKNNVITFFTFIITVLLTKLASAGSLTGAFSKEITIISYLILLGSLIFIYIGIVEMNHKINKLWQGYDGLKNNYNDFLDESDIKEIFKNDDIIQGNINEIYRYKKNLTHCWIAFLAVAFVSIEFVSSSPLFLPQAICWLRDAIR